MKGTLLFRIHNGCQVTALTILYLLPTSIALFTAVCHATVQTRLSTYIDVEVQKANQKNYLQIIN